MKANLDLALLLLILLIPLSQVGERIDVIGVEGVKQVTIGVLDGNVGRLIREIMGDISGDFAPHDFNESALA
jgi:hypothetical protein